VEPIKLSTNPYPVLYIRNQLRNGISYFIIKMNLVSCLMGKRMVSSRLLNSIRFIRKLKGCRNRRGWAFKAKCKKAEV